MVSPDLLARATRVVRKYQADYGHPLTAGQLAARLRIDSDLAAQALTLITLDPDTNPTVNGRPAKATR